MPDAALSRILFIDAYDSFTNNIVSLLEIRLRVNVTVIKIDDEIKDFNAFLKPFAAVVAGPGPGDPRRPKDVGLIEELWKLSDEDALPVLGICLGFQSLAHHFGGKIDRLPEPRHGIVRKVRSTGGSIFRGVDEIETVQYHSLHASLPFIDDADASQQGSPWGAYPALKPLAWDHTTDNEGETSPGSLDASLPRVLMAVEHTSKPFFGVQFHAESICSSEEARKIIDAWWENAVAWNACHRDCDLPVNGYPTPPQEATTDVRLPIDEPLEDVEEFQPVKYRRTSDRSRGALHSVRHNMHQARLPSTSRINRHGMSSGQNARSNKESPNTQVIARAIDVDRLTISSICETLDLTEGEAIILDSEQYQRPEVGEMSIIGLVSPNSLRFEYNIDHPEVRRTSDGITTTVSLGNYDGSIFAYFKDYMKNYKPENQNTDIPFWGGLMGYVSYEACLETVGTNESPGVSETGTISRPDLSFVFVERSIVIDHIKRTLYVQSISPKDDDWVSNTASLLEIRTQILPIIDAPILPALKTALTLPNESFYKSKVRACQRSIRAGDAYELCLTTQATIKTTTKQASWSLYQRLRKLNPSPFSAYLHFGNLSLLSSSPERFLKWSRPGRRKTPDNSEENGKSVTCQFRPIKGTVKRQPDPAKPPLTLAEATALLSTPKERAENLMIVDLIRHDLHGVVGSGNVTVPKLMVVEEYATLFQLVSVIEGTLAINDSDSEDEVETLPLANSNPQILKTGFHHMSPPTPKSKPSQKSGIDILASSLPPGSMTGAPKLRSCQLLRELENRKRGIYSGVVGYMDVGGGGDFSVVIRSAVRWDGDEDGGDGDTWTIGAGGAVTAMSTEDGEWEEMVAKLKSTLRLFEDEA